MNAIITFFARNQVAANLLMLTVLVGGLMAMFTIKRELIPTITLESINIQVPYPGATPAEVEEGVILRVEEAIADLEGVKNIDATASEGVGLVVAEVMDGYEVRQLLDDIKVRIDAISTFPADVEQPVVEEITIRNRILNLALSGPVDDRTLRQRAEHLREDILALPGITQVELRALPEPEIGIEIPEDVLRRYNLSFAEVEVAIRQSSIDLPAGSIKSSGGDVLLRTRGQAYTAEEFAAVVLRTGPAGERLLLGEVAEVVDGFEEVDLWSRFDGERAAILEVYRVGEQDVVTVSRTVLDYIAERQFAPGMTLTPYNDSSVYFQQRVDTLTSNGISGLLLVLIALTLFLRLRLAFWVTLGIPIAFAGALWMMPYWDATLNMISLFAFILVLGIVVDDAIVVGEAIHDEQENGETGIEGAIRGAKRMAKPVTFAVLTTIIAFMPLLFVSGPTGRFYRLLPIVVIGCLIFSIVECLMILPAHLGGGKTPEGRKRTWLERLQDRITALLRLFIQRVYRPILETAMRWRYVTFAGFFATLLLTIGLVFGGHLRRTWFPEIAADFVVAKFELPEGVPREQTEAVIDEIETALEQVRAEVVGEHEVDVIRYVQTSLGFQPGGAGQGRQSSSGPRGAHVGEIAAELINLEGTGLSGRDLGLRWRSLLGDIPGVKRLTFESDLSGRGQEIQVRLASSDLDRLQQASAELQEHLLSYRGITDASDSLSGGKQEITATLRPEGALLGLRTVDLARQLRQAYFGAEAQRIQRGRDDIRVLVRYPQSVRQDIGSLRELRIRTADGAEVPLARVADLEVGRGFTSIRRVDRRRIVDIRAEVDETKDDPNRIKATVEGEFLPALVERHSGLRWSIEGRDKDQRENADDLMAGFVLALLAMYALMAIAFGSYIQPVLLMAAIPFGAVGAVVGHMILGMPLSMLSAFGIVALAGVVVNDNLVLVDAVNNLRAGGMTLKEAVVTAGCKRLRPILLTTLTTFLGLTPLLLETSVQAQFLIPMALALASGVVYATTVTLILVPCLYLVIEDLKRVFAIPARLVDRVLAD